MVDLVYNEAKFQIASGTINLLTDDLRVLLVTPNYIPDPDHSFVSDGVETSPINFELDGTGYVAGFDSDDRQALLNRSVVKDEDVDRARLFADNIIWNPISAGAAGAAIIFKSVTADTDSPMIAYIQSGGFPLTTDGGELQLRFNSTSGVLTLS